MSSDLERLSDIVRRLLGPGGCPWDQRQTLASLRPYLLEETHEVLDAIDEQSPDHHCEELGDLLFQIVFQAELAGHSLSDVIQGIADKLVRRHPHVFGDATVEDVAQVRANWDQIKQLERAEKAEPERGALDGVPRSMPALPRAHQLSAKAAKVGFDWPDADAVRSKVMEEIGELTDVADGEDTASKEHELGDLLFAVVNWARKLDLDPELALLGANRRFVARFGHVESELRRQGRTPAESTLDEMEGLWQEAKRKERPPGAGAKRPR